MCLIYTQQCNVYRYSIYNTNPNSKLYYVQNEYKQLKYKRTWQVGWQNSHRGCLSTKYSLFRLTSLIYAKKFEFENLAIMEDKQCKQTERFSVMAKESNYFLSLDDKIQTKI